MGETKDENKERGNWTGKLDFILSCIGFAVGLGNIWRFPYLAYENGGASFLIPYLVFLLTAGLPLFYMELAFGQFANLGPITIWRCAPFFKGIGYAMAVISGLVCIYYNVIIAWSIYFMFASFNTKLPWEGCQNAWNTPRCVERSSVNMTQRNITATLCSYMKDMNQTNTTSYINKCIPKTPSEEFWENKVLNVSPSITEGYGDFSWQVVLCLTLAWVVIFFCLVKGIKSSGKVVYVTATFPYIILTILLVRGVTLPGAIDGIKFYLIPDWNRMTDARAWGRAATQIFYSLGVGFGGLVTMSSYNRFHNNVHRDAVLVAIINCATSIYGGFAIFSVLGFMAHTTGIPIESVVTSGPGLAFIAYPEGLAMMPVAPLWSVLFFFMIFTLGLDSQFAMMETVITAITDEFISLRNYKVVVTLTLCISLFLLGLPMCSRAGIWILQLFDWYSAGFSLFIVSLLEVIGIQYVYGIRRFSRDIEMMLGSKPNYYWMATWAFITPAMIVFIIVYSAVQHTEVSYNGMDYPWTGVLAGWLMVGAALLFIPLLAVIVILQNVNWGGVFKPKESWGPAVQEYRTGDYAKYGDKVESSLTNDANIHGNMHHGAYSNSAYLSDGMKY